MAGLVFRRDSDGGFTAIKAHHIILTASHDFFALRLERKRGQPRNGLHLQR